MGATAKGDRCPICDELVASREENHTFPFCSERCQTIDLGHWLDERYRIPTSDRSGDGDSDPN